MIFSFYINFCVSYYIHAFGVCNPCSRKTGMERWDTGRVSSTLSSLTKFHWSKCRHPLSQLAIKPISTHWSLTTLILIPLISSSMPRRAQLARWLSFAILCMPDKKLHKNEEWSQIQNRSKDHLDAILPYFHNVILSPGPGRPQEASDFGIGAVVLRETELAHLLKIPVLGVCLGHQGMAIEFGGPVGLMVLLLTCL